MAKPWYSISTSSVIQSLSLSTPDIEQVWLAEYSGGVRRIKSLCIWYQHLSMEGKKYGYLVNGTKSWLIVKSQALADEAHRVFGDEVNITTDGKRYPGAVIGFKEYNHQFCKEQMSVCRGNLKHFPKLQGVNPIQPTLHLQRGQVEIYNIFCAIKSCMRRLCSSNPRSAECITSADYLRARRTAS